MSAEGLLDNPAIFSATEHNKNRLDLALEYLSLVDKYPVKMKSVVFHTRRIARDELNAYQQMEELCACDSVEKMREILLQCKQYQEDGSYQYDPEKAVKAKQALEKRKHEEVRPRTQPVRHSLNSLLLAFLCSIFVDTCALTLIFSFSNKLLLTSM